MKKRWVQRILPILIFGILTRADFANADDKFSSVKLNDGVNYIDINNDGRKDMIIKAWWENNNAHGYYLYTFLINNPDAEHKKQEIERSAKEVGQDNYLDWERRNSLATGQAFEWLVVGFEHKEHGLTNSFQTFQGADCVLYDIYLLKNKDDKIDVIMAKRPFKESFFEKLKVTFYRYALVEDDEGLMGYPPFRFVYEGKMTTKNSYCDVNEAFEKEYEILFNMNKKSPKDMNKKR